MLDMLKSTYSLMKVQCYWSYSCLNRWVFNALLKVPIFSTWRNCTGSEFHSFGPDTRKDLSPYDTVLVLGITRFIPFWDRRVLPGVYTSNISVMYLGASLCNARNVCNATLYCILRLIGNQWRFLNTGVMCSLFLVCVIILAAVFWTRCKRSKVEDGSPLSTTLQ